MTEFWETNFKDKGEMWGENPVDSVYNTVELFKTKEFNEILVPGYGYGRNANVFSENGFNITGIELSETAISLAKKHYGNDIKVHHGSVSDMPFDQNQYDGIYCYSLLHLLSSSERNKLIKDCYNQLRPGGLMVFVTLSTNDPRYKQGEEVEKNRFISNHGIGLLFHDKNSIETEFNGYSLIEVIEINEPTIQVGKQPQQKFWQIICEKSPPTTCG